MEKTVTFDNAAQLAETYCNRRENLEEAEETLGVKIVARDGWMSISGRAKNAEAAEKFFAILRSARKQGIRIGNADFGNMLARAAKGKLDEIAEVFANPVVVNLKRKSIVPKNISQKKYLNFIKILLSAG